MTRLEASFFGYKTTKNLVFHIAILQIYLVSKGFTFDEIFLFFAISGLTSLIFEVPTGVFSDRFGRRISLMFGIVLRSLALVLLVLSPDITALLLCALILSLGNAFGSGSDSALVYDSLLMSGQEHHYGKMERVGYIAELATYGLAAGVGSWIGSELRLDLPVLLSSIGIATGVVFVYGLPEERPMASKRSNNGHVRVNWPEIRQTIISREFLFVAIAFIAFDAVIDVGTLLYQPSMIMLGVDTRWFGIGVAALVVVDMIAVWFSGRRWFVIQSASRGFAIVFLFLFLFLLLLLVSLLSNDNLSLWLLAVGFSFHAIADGIQFPLVRIWANRLHRSQSRATILSMLTGSAMIVTGVVTIGVGRIVATSGPEGAFVVLLIILAIATVLLFLIGRRSPSDLRS